MDAPGNDLNEKLINLSKLKIKKNICVCDNI